MCGGEEQHSLIEVKQSLVLTAHVGWACVSLLVLPDLQPISQAYMQALKHCYVVHIPLNLSKCDNVVVPYKQNVMYYSIIAVKRVPQ